MTNQVTPTSIRVGYAVLMVVILTGIVGLVWPDRPSWVLWAETGLILAVLAFFVYKRLRRGRPPGAATPVQMVGVYAAFMAVVLTQTAIVWKWPDSSPWILSSLTVLFIAGMMLWAYRATRKKI